MELFVGGREVIFSDTLVQYDEEPIEIKFSRNPYMRLRFTFLTDDSDNPSYHTNFISDNELEIQLTNYNNPLGTGVSPRRYGILGGRELFFGFVVRGFGKPVVRTVTLTISLGDVSEGGATEPESVPAERKYKVRRSSKSASEAAATVAPD